MVEHSGGAGGVNWRGHALAVTSVALATLLTWLLARAVGPENMRVPSALFFATVLLVSTFGGRAPGILATLLSALAINFFFLPPIQAPALTLEGLLQLCVFVFVALLINHLTHRNRVAEAQARRSELRSGALLRALPDLMFRISRDGVLLDYSAARVDDLQVPPDKFVRRNLREVMPDLADPTLQHVARALDTRAPQRFEYQLGQDDSRRDYEARIVASGQDEVVAVVRDITERRHAEDERAQLSARVEAERRRLNELLASVPGVVWEAWGEPDASSQRINFVSDYVETMLGYTVEEWLATPNFWRTIVHPDNRERAAQEAYAIFLGGKPGVSEFRWVAKDGRVVPVEAQSVPVLDAAGNPVGMRGVTMDISARRRAEEALRESEARLRVAQQAAKVGTWEWDVATGEALWSEGVWALLGLEPGSMPTTFAAWIQYIHPEDRERAARGADEALRAGGDDYEDEFRLVRPDGRVLWLASKGRIVRGEGGRVERVLGANIDITERKQEEIDRQFLLELGDKIRFGGQQPGELLDEVSRAASEHVGAARCMFVEIDEARNRGVVRHEFSRAELPSVPREYRVSDYSPATLADIKGGRVVVNHDAEHDPRTSAIFATTYEPYAERSYVSVPLFSGGRWAAIFWVSDDRARRWAPREVALLTTVGERAWLAAEKLRADAELRESEARLRLALDISRTSTFEIDLLTDAVRTDETGREIYGWAPDEALTFSRVQTQFHPDDRERVRQSVAAALDPQGPGGFEVEQRIVRTGGETRWIRVHGRAFFQGEGDARRAVRCLGTYIDITERKLAEAALRESEGRYRALAEAMPLIVWTARPDGGYDYYNQRWFDYTGLTFEQTRGWGWQPVVHPKDLERAVRRWARCVQTGEDLEIELRFRRAAGGAYRWHLQRAQALRDEQGRVVKWFGTSTDIDDQKRTEEALRFLSDADAALSSSLDYEETLKSFARLAVPRLADWCAVDMLGADGELRRLAAEHVDPAKVELARELERRYPPEPGATQGAPNVARTGRPEIYAEIPDELIVAAARDEGHLRLLRALDLRSALVVPLAARGRPLGALTLIMAESGRRYGAHDLALAEDLARRASVAIDNAQLYRRTEEANRAKDEFLATLSHELRTPLTPIAGWVQMLRAGRVAAADLPRGLHVIDRNTQALTRLINDLLDMSAIMSGKLRIERAVVVLAPVLEQAAEAARAEAERRGVALELEVSGCEGPALAVSGDRTRLLQVFTNLLNNAVKFCTDGCARVRLSCAAESGEARIVVADEGAGIAPEFLPHVFERFRQADSTTTRAHGGLGLGLALVKSFVEAHGGHVRAESAGEGHGSRFAVTLPALPVGRGTGDKDEDALTAAATAAHEEQPSSAPSGEQQPPPPSTRVLVVEDARDTLELLQTLFETRGFAVTLCETAEEAIAVAAGGRFDIIVSDIGLPQTDGYELIRQLRLVPHLRATPAVALTGYAGPRDAEAALSAGFDAHVPKPVDPLALVETVERLLSEVVARP